MAELRVEGLTSQSGSAIQYILEILVMGLRRMWIPTTILTLPLSFKTMNDPLCIGNVYAILPRLKKKLALDLLIPHLMMTAFLK